jgi:hypothetical protein
MVICGIDGIELSPRSGNLVVSSCVYADLNWLFSISALLLLSLCIIPLLALRGATPELFCFIIPLLPEGGGGYTVLPLSVLPSVQDIFFGAFFSVTVDGGNLIFGHKHHIGIPYCG